MSEFENMQPAEQFMLGAVDKTALAARIKALADEYADAQVRLENAQTVMSIQVGSHRVEKLEAELHAAIDALARA